MKAQELRIGNYIAASGNKENIETWVIGKVHSISSEDSQFEQIEVETEEEFTWVFKDNYFGIPLSEDWLLRLGAKRYDHSDKERGYVLGHTEPSKCIYIRTYCEPNISGFFTVFNKSECNKNELQFLRKVEYVHTFQNLYHALTGEELTFKQG